MDFPWQISDLKVTYGRALKLVMHKWSGLDVASKKPTVLQDKDSGFVVDAGNLGGVWRFVFVLVWLD